MKPEIILIGGGGHCKSCIDVIEQEGKFKILGILDVPEKIGDNILSYKVIGSDLDIPKMLKETKNFLITVGQIKSPEKRITLYQLIKRLVGNLPALISPMAYVSRSALIGEGTIVMHFAMINANAKVGANCIINSKALVEHDAIIDDHCHISTTAVINGNVKIGAGCYIGANATILQNIEICENVIIGAGAVVTKSITSPNTVWAGVPARELKNKKA